MIGGLWRGLSSPGRNDARLLILKHVPAGDNGYGQLGLGDTEDRGDTGYYDDNWDLVIFNEMGDNLPAVSLGTGLTATAIACGDSFTCALLSNAHVKCWGGSRPPLSALLVHG